MKQMKIRINSPEHSEQVQKALFELGYEWQSDGQQVRNTLDLYLFTGSWQPEHITCSCEEETFNNKNFPEYVLQNGTLVPANTNQEFKVGNTAIVKKVKDNYTREEVIKLFNKLENRRNDFWPEDATTLVPLDEWLEENL